MPGQVTDQVLSIAKRSNILLARNSYRIKKRLPEENSEKFLRSSIHEWEKTAGKKDKFDGKNMIHIKNFRKMGVPGFIIIT